MEQVRLPRFVGRPGLVLAIVLLLLLCWPGRGNVPMPLAQLPATSPTQPPTPPEPQRQTADSRQQTEHGQSGQQGGQQQASGQQGHDGSQPSTGGSQQSRPQGGGSDQQQPDGGQKTAGPASVGTPPEGGGAKQQTGDQHKQHDGGQQPNGSAPHDAQQQPAGSNTQQAADGAKSAGQQGNQGRDPAGSPQGKGNGQSGTQSSASNIQQAGQGGGQSAAGEGTKAQIQQLLKEVSGELKQLQAQLAAANDQPRQEPGTGTDPELYGDADTLDHAKGSPLPVQLDADTVETKAKRPGSGAGQPAGEAASATPQTQAEDAQLSEQPLEETPAAHQTIPPEYQPVFKRLQQQKDTTP